MLIFNKIASVSMLIFKMWTKSTTKIAFLLPNTSILLILANMQQSHLYQRKMSRSWLSKKRCFRQAQWTNLRLQTRTVFTQISLRQCQAGRIPFLTTSRNPLCIRVSEVEAHISRIHVVHHDQKHK
jgi:hypothetical protein